MISPKKYNTLRRSESSEEAIPNLRRSKRRASKDADDEQPENKKPKIAEFADIPDYIGPMNTNDSDDRCELLVDPEQSAQLSDDSVRAYLAAAGNKLGADNHACFLHLVQNGYDLKQALESIDAPDSLPRTSVHGANGTGIWTERELKAFAKQLNTVRSPKQIQRLKQVLPNKTRSNIVSAYYKLKKYGCIGTKKAFCHNKLKAAKMELGVRSADCGNCRDKLWMKPLAGDLNSTVLCALCLLYLRNFGSMRPNAAVTEEIFDFGPLSDCNCESDLAEANEECLAVLRQCEGKDIIAIRRTHYRQLVQKLKGITVSRAAKKLISEWERFQVHHTYLFVCRSGIESLSEFKRFDFGVSSEADTDSGIASSPDLSMASSPGSSSQSSTTDENGDPGTASELIDGLTKAQVFAELRKVLNDSNPDLTFEMVQQLLKAHNINLPDSIGEEFYNNAESQDQNQIPEPAPAPEPSDDSEYDCMFYGTINKDGKILPATDAAFNKYLKELKNKREAAIAPMEEADPASPAPRSRRKAPKRAKGRRAKRSR